MTLQHIRFVIGENLRCNSNMITFYNFKEYAELNTMFDVPTFLIGVSLKVAV